MRRPIIAANAKKHKTRPEARAFVSEFASLSQGTEGTDIVLAPPFTALPALAESLGQLAGHVELAAQNVHPEPTGALTGEISIPMLEEIGCQRCIVGHSERRSLFGEDDDFVAAKVQALQAAGISPIVCVGESLAERDADQPLNEIENQLAGPPPPRAPARAPARSWSLPMSRAGRSGPGKRRPRNWPRRFTP